MIGVALHGWPYVAYHAVDLFGVAAIVWAVGRMFHGADK